MRLTLQLSRCSAVTALALSLVAAGHAEPAPGSSATVVYVGGNDVVLRGADGKLMNYVVSPADKFASASGSLTLAQLKPGTALTQPVSSAIQPKLVASVAVVKGKVYASTPPDTLTLSLTEGIKEVKVPAGETFMIAGKPMTTAELQPGMPVEATVVTTAAEGAAPDPASAAVTTPPMVGPLLVANTAAAGESDLPLAGTNLPLYGMMGAALVGLGAMFTMRRRRTEQTAA